MNKNIGCCIFSHEITKGMKSHGQIGLLRSSAKNKELLYYSIRSIQKYSQYHPIHLIIGFEEEKIKKNLTDYNMSINTIYNEEYDTKNYGYAFKLFLQNIDNTYIDNVKGVLFILSNIVIKHLPKFNPKESWILTKKRYKTTQNYIGCTLQDCKVNYMFYNIGESVWTDVFYLTSTDIKKIISGIHNYYDHMFMFEIINTMIEKQKIDIRTVTLDKISDIVKINGLKDKHKIK